MAPPAVATGISSSSRLHYLDWIRVLALVAVFLVHALGGLPYMWPSFIPGGGAWLGVVAALGIGLFFLVSGAASIFSLERRSSKQYLRERVFRLAVPFLVGGAVLVPLTIFLRPVQLRRFVVVGGLARVGGSRTNSSLPGI